LRVRRALNEVDFIGAWQMLQRFILPKIQAIEDGINDELTRDFYIYRWVMRAALATDAYTAQPKHQAVEYWDYVRAAQHTFMQDWANDFESAPTISESQDMAQYVYVEEWAPVTKLSDCYYANQSYLCVDWEDSISELDMLGELMANYSIAVADADPAS
jgi:hypothetical protein